jgi:uncharacterized phosphosugar-binding protein
MDYLDQVIDLLDEVRRTQAEAIELAAQVIAKAIQAGHLVYVFGAGHASILAQELFYRAGGLVPVNPILPPGLTTDVRPVTLTTRLERLAGYMTQVIAESPIQEGDVFIVHSVSGRNPAGIEAALAAHQSGAFVIALTSLAYSRSVQPRQAGQPRLFEAADLVLDNCAPVGDALVALQGISQKIGPVSTVSGAAILNAVVARAAALILAHSGDVPIFMSANLDGGETHNQKWLETYKNRLTYL